MFFSNCVWFHAVGHHLRNDKNKVIEIWHFLENSTATRFILKKSIKIQFHIVNTFDIQMRTIRLDKTYFQSDAES